MNRLRFGTFLAPSIMPVYEAVAEEVGRRRILSVLVRLHEDRDVRERLSLGLVKRFVPVGPSSYDDIRMMLEACEAAEFMQLR